MTSSRRTFLLASAASAGALALPSCQAGVTPRSKKPLDQKLRLMVIGVAGRGGDNLHGVAGEDITILCDVDRRHLDGAAKQFPQARPVTDFRTILNDPAEGYRKNNQRPEPPGTHQTTIPRPAAAVNAPAEPREPPSSTPFRPVSRLHPRPLPARPIGRPSPADPPAPLPLELLPLPRR